MGTPRQFNLGDIVTSVMRQANSAPPIASSVPGGIIAVRVSPIIRVSEELSGVTYTRKNAAGSISDVTPGMFFTDLDVAEARAHALVTAIFNEQRGIQR